MSFLIFNTKAEALNRTEQAGKDANLGYHTGDPNGCRYIWPVIEESGENRGALDIEGHAHLLTEEEKNQLVSELPEDWQFPVDP
tara:strand:+ start:295 stop:546 length:252 start_codon:yes stop_codon:yes gene_type:complete